MPDWSDLFDFGSDFGGGDDWGLGGAFVGGTDSGSYYDPSYYGYDSTQFGYPDSPYDPMGQGFSPGGGGLSSVGAAAPGVFGGPSAESLASLIGTGLGMAGPLAGLIGNIVGGGQGPTARGATSQTRTLTPEQQALQAQGMAAAGQLQPFVTGQQPSPINVPQAGNIPGITPGPPINVPSVTIPGITPPAPVSIPGNSANGFQVSPGAFSPNSYLPGLQGFLEKMRSGQGLQGLMKTLSPMISKAYEPFAQGLMTQATNAGRSAGFYDAPGSSPVGSAILGPGLAQLQGQQAQSLLQAVLQQIPQAAISGAAPFTAADQTQAQVMGQNMQGQIAAGQSGAQAGLQTQQLGAQAAMQQYVQQMQAELARQDLLGRIGMQGQSLGVQAQEFGSNQQQQAQLQLQNLLAQQGSQTQQLGVQAQQATQQQQLQAWQQQMNAAATMSQLYGNLMGPSGTTQNTTQTQSQPMGPQIGQGIASILQGGAIGYSAMEQQAQQRAQQQQQQQFQQSLLRTLGQNQAPVQPLSQTLPLYGLDNY